MTITPCTSTTVPPSTPARRRHASHQQPTHGHTTPHSHARTGGARHAALRRKGNRARRSAPTAAAPPIPVWSRHGQPRQSPALLGSGCQVLPPSSILPAAARGISVVATRSAAGASTLTRRRIGLGPASAKRPLRVCWPFHREIHFPTPPAHRQLARAIQRRPTPSPL